MYIEMFDRKINHIANVMDVKYNFIKRAYDLDTSNFSGLTSNDVTNAFIFVLCENNGTPIYSGFATAISQNEKIVSFKGKDFKSQFDSEIILDYATELKPSPRTLSGIFNDVVLSLDNDISWSYPILPVEFVVPNDETDVNWIANFDSQYVIVNGKAFLKTYLGYYGYHISSHFDRQNKKLIYEFKKTDEEINIKLNDFTHEFKKNDLTTNKTIATLQFETIDKSEKEWVETDEGYYNSAPEDKRIEVNQSDNIKPNLNANDYEIGLAVKVVYSSPGSPLTGTYYFSAAYASIARPDDLPYREYWLGLDNNIYSGIVVFDNMILPIKTKIFEDVNFQNAQYNAIYELVNNRYNENIILTNTKAPIDLSKITLNTMVNVYDSNGDIKSLPVSEITNNNGLLHVKLGYKKTLFTEVVKDADEPVIKSTSSGTTNIFQEEGIPLAETKPDDHPANKLWFKITSID